MATRHETEYENITFSFTVREQNFASHFEWNGVRMVTPWHQTYFKVIIKVYDEKTNWLWLMNLMSLPISVNYINVKWRVKNS